MGTAAELLTTIGSILAGVAGLSGRVYGSELALLDAIEKAGATAGAVLELGEEDTDPNTPQLSTIEVAIRLYATVSTDADGLQGPAAVQALRSLVLAVTRQLGPTDGVITWRRKGGGETMPLPRGIGHVGGYCELLFESMVEDA